jgi:hypothetical protein
MGLRTGFLSIILIPQLRAISGSDFIHSEKAFPNMLCENFLRNIEAPEERPTGPT